MPRPDHVVSADWVVPVEGAPIEDGAVALEADRIVAVGRRDEIGEGERFEDAIVVPAFVNTHSHLEYAVYAGFGDGLPFGPWLATHIERKARIGWGEFVAIARLGASECLRSGIGTVGDASFSGAAAHAAADLGLGALVFLEVFGSDAVVASERLDELRARVDAVLSERVRLGVSPHAPYSVGVDVYRQAYALGLPVATHVAESADELDYLARGEGPIAAVSDVVPPGTTPVRHLAAQGLLERRVVAAHCVKVDEEEIELLARHDVAVAHCPRSNALLGCGIAPVAELRAAGIRVGLGTDSPASTPSFDMFEEMRTAIYAARARGERPDALRAEDALELATLGAAGALGLADEVGSLAPGKRADLAVVSLSGSPYLPWEDPAAAIVFGGSPERVQLTLVGGEERYRKGGTAWHELRRAAAEARGRLLDVLPRAPKT
ncbi:MAG TPA: amidohydrolase family protein [Gaiellaceae bacterium]|nr:amidohydrolase family protein [Gaiellaceae bacterium]